MWSDGSTQLTIPVAVLAFCTVVLSARAARRDLDAPLPAGLLAAGLASAFIATPWVLCGASWPGALALGALTVSCALIAEIDRRFMLIPDELVIAVVLSGVAGILARPLGAASGEDLAVLMGLGAGRALAGAGALGIVFLGVRAWFGQRRRIEALGMGDVKLAAAMGAVLGVHDGFLAVAAAGVGMIGAMVISRNTERAVSALPATGRVGSVAEPDAGSACKRAASDATPPGAAPFGIALTAALLAFAWAQFWASL